MCPIELEIKYQKGIFNAMPCKEINGNGENRHGKKVICTFNTCAYMYSRDRTSKLQGKILVFRSCRIFFR